MKFPWDVYSVELAVTKHFALNYLRYWGWDFHDLRHAISEAYKIVKEGRKYEIYVQKDGFKKIITVYYSDEDKLLCITRSEGGVRK